MRGFSHPLIFIQPLSKSAVGGGEGKGGWGMGKNWIWGGSGGIWVRVNTDGESPLSFQDEHSKNQFEPWLCRLCNVWDESACVIIPGTSVEIRIHMMQGTSCLCICSCLSKYLIDFAYWVQLKRDKVLIFLLKKFPLNNFLQHFLRQSRGGWLTKGERTSYGSNSQHQWFCTFTADSFCGGGRGVAA